MQGIKAGFLLDRCQEKIPLQPSPYLTHLHSSLMPTVAPPAKALVTGANGYVAVWVVQTLLERGYSVRGTVRSESKGVHLKQLFEKYGDKFECVVVEDITKVRSPLSSSSYHPCGF